MGVAHVFHAVGDKLARGEGIEHALVPHSDAVVDGDCVEFLRDSACLFDFRAHESPDFVEVDMSRNELGEGVRYRDYRLAEVGFFDARGAP